MNFQYLRSPPNVKRGQVRAMAVAVGRARARRSRAARATWVVFVLNEARSCGQRRSVNGCARARAALCSRPAVTPRLRWRCDIHWHVSCALRWMAGGRGRKACTVVVDYIREAFRHAFEVCDLCVPVSVPAVGAVVR